MRASMARRFELYGKRRASRRERRAMLALLTGAGNVSGATAFMLGGGSGTFYVLTARLERRGYVIRERREAGYGEEYPGYRYRLTPAGRAALLEILGLTEYDPADTRWRAEPVAARMKEDT